MTGPAAKGGWHSVVEVRLNRPRPDWAPDALGAFVHVLALAHGEIDFRERVAATLEADGFTVIGWDRILPFDRAVDDWKTEEASELHAYLCDAHPVQYSHFDTYPKDGLDG